MTEKEICEILHRLKYRFDTIKDFENVTVEIEDKEIEVVKLALKALKDLEGLKEENHRNFVNSQYIISLLVEENQKLRGEKKYTEKKITNFYTKRFNEVN